MSRRKRNNSNQSNLSKGWNTDQYWQSASYNSRLFDVLRNQILELAMSRFTWLNLPRTCDPRYLEWLLIFEGQATIAFPSKEGMEGQFFSTQAVQTNHLNIYQNPTKWDSYGVNGWRFPVNHGNGVFVFDNLTRMPLIYTIDIWARELVDIMRTKQVNRVHQKMPFILKGDQTQYFDMVNLWKQAAGGEPAILVSKDTFNEIEADVLKTDVPFIGKELDEAYKNTWAEIYKALGIPSLPFKTERQIEDEVDSLNEPTELARLSPLKARRMACTELNERFGAYLEAPIDVVFSKDLISDNYNYTHDIQKQEEVEDDTALQSVRPDA